MKDKPIGRKRNPPNDHVQCNVTVFTDEFVTLISYSYDNMNATPFSVFASNKTTRPSCPISAIIKPTKKNEEKVVMSDQILCIAYCLEVCYAFFHTIYREVYAHKEAWLVLCKFIMWAGECVRIIPHRSRRHIV